MINKNATMIIYVLYDVIRFLYEQKETQLNQGNDITEIEEQIQTVQDTCSLYLKTTLGEHEMHVFQREIKETL